MDRVGRPRLRRAIDAQEPSFHKPRAKSQKIRRRRLGGIFGLDLAFAFFYISSCGEI
jgi:hypothetical protein